MGGKFQNVSLRVDLLIDGRLFTQFSPASLLDLNSVSQRSGGPLLQNKHAFFPLYVILQEKL